MTALEKELSDMQHELSKKKEENRDTFEQEKEKEDDKVTKKR